MKEEIQQSNSAREKDRHHQLISQSSKHLSVFEDEEDKVEEEDQTEQMMAHKINDPGNSLPNILPNIYLQSQNSRCPNMNSTKLVEAKGIGPKVIRIIIFLI